MYKAISLGWGVQSFTLAAMSALGELPPVDVAIHADTGHEMAATYTFAAQWTPWLEEHGVRVATVRNEKSDGQAVVLTSAAGGMTHIPAHTVDAQGRRGRIQRQCTGHWKIEPLRRYIQAQRGKERAALWLGITLDEWQRAKSADVQYLTHEFPLLDLQMTRLDCLDWLQGHGLPAPVKSSCTFCPFKNKAAWEEMKRAGGADWEEAVTVDAAIRHARPPGLLFVHGKTLPLAEAVIIPEDYGYSQLELLSSDDADAECDSGACFL